MDFDAGFDAGAAFTPDVADPAAWDTRPLDFETVNHGLEGPFKDYASDTGELVQVLHAARHARLTLRNNVDEVADRVLASRWLAAARDVAANGVLITNLREADSLPLGSQLRSDDGVLFMRLFGSEWSIMGSTRTALSAHISYPARLLGATS